MRKFALVFIVAIISLAFTIPADPIRIFMAGDSTMAIKDQKAFPETGWGMPFVYFWNDAVEVVNLAKNGRSTKSFRKEGLWEQMYGKMERGDYVFIQFGHNDESKDKGERYSPPDSFKLNLKQFISEARSKNAIPVLISPVSRRKFDANGMALETHAEYTPLVAEVAKETGVIFIDLDARSRALYQQFGPEMSKYLFLQLKPGEHPNHPNGKDDNTHFSELGARLIAQIILEEVKVKIPELYTYTRNQPK